MKMSQNSRHYPCRLKFLLVLLISAFANTFSFAQTNVTVSGKVSDPDTKMPLPGVSVTVRGKATIGVITDEKGNYAITVPAGAVLVFSYLSNAPEEIVVSKSGIKNVLLSSTAKSMDEVVVIGFGSRKKKDVTGAISTVTSKDIEKITALSPELALQGRTAGVFVSSGGGDPQARGNCTNKRCEHFW